MTKAKAKPLSPVEEAEVRQVLENMEENTLYNTESHYVADSVKYPTNVITFSQKHMDHLRKYPSINPEQYISNLKLMTKTR